MKKVGIYGGSFDPPHLGHLCLAVDTLETTEIDEVWFCPSKVSPFKEGDEVTPFEERLAMMELSASLHNQLKVSSVEGSLSTPSYTIETMRHLSGQFKEIDFSLIVGQDVFDLLPKWQEAHELLKNWQIFVGVRPGSLSRKFDLPPELIPIAKVNFVSNRSVEVSSTELRKRLKNKDFCGHLLDYKVLDYIAVNKLYS